MNYNKTIMISVKISAVGPIRKQTGYRLDLIQSENDNAMRSRSTEVKIRARSTYGHRRDIHLVLNLSKMGNHNQN